MGNFDFLRTTLPTVHPDCVRAESYVTSDPRAACIYGRRAVEVLIGHLYDLLALKRPYRDDLNARMNDAAFQTAAGLGIVQKLNLIRKIGNTAAHEQKVIPPRTALDVLRELHHVMVWAAFHHSPDPQSVPTQAFRPGTRGEGGPALPGGSESAGGEVRRAGCGPRQGSR